MLQSLTTFRLWLMRNFDIGILSEMNKESGLGKAFGKWLGGFARSKGAVSAKAGLSQAKTLLAGAAKGSVDASRASKAIRAAKSVIKLDNTRRLQNLIPLSRKAKMGLLIGGVGAYALNEVIPDAPKGNTAGYRLQEGSKVPITKNKLYTGRHAAAQNALRYIPIGQRPENVTNFTQAWVKEMEKNPEYIKSMEEAGRPILTSKRPDQLESLKKYPGLWDTLRRDASKTVKDITGQKDYFKK